MYTPQPGDEGLQLLAVALRDYILSEASIVELLPEGVESVVPEGFLTSETPTPVLLIAKLGHGESAAGGS